MKKILLICLFLFSYGSNMEILSEHFEYNQTSNISKFTGDVNVTKGKDNILSNELYIFMNKNRKLNKLFANGNVKFVVKNGESIYEGKSDKLTYFAPKQIFIFEGNVYIKKLDDNQQLFGNKVIINKKNGTASILGKKNKPLKFIIKVND